LFVCIYHHTWVRLFLLAHLSTTLHHPCCSPRRDPHTPEPDTFNGNVENCRGFLLQCRRLLDHLPRTYITDREKISFIINCLRGKALLWPPVLPVRSPSPYISHLRVSLGR
uniref:DUF4939 domain-containing protein n=1 Tax=Monopterus albus TaxID=43700 RepID=A0A3Q3JJA3_MONAL